MLGSQISFLVSLVEWSFHLEEMSEVWTKRSESETSPWAGFRPPPGHLRWPLLGRRSPSGSWATKEAPRGVPSADPAQAAPS